MRGSSHGFSDDKDLSSKRQGAGSAEVPTDSLADVTPGGTADRFEINFFELCQLLIRQRKWIFGIVIPVMFLVALRMFTMPNVYRSEAVILPSGIPEGMGAMEELVGLSGAAGILSENSSLLYPLILQSNLIRDSVLDQVYDITFKNKPMRILLSEYFREDDPNRLRENLGDITTVTSYKRTGEIRISVETKYPELSRAILSEYLEQLENYNRFTRKSAARESQRYLEKRLVAAGRELVQAEEELKDFREANRNWANTTDPTILRDLIRLQRNLEIKTSNYLFLENKLEVAKFNAQKDIPIVRILDWPSLPTIKSGPPRMITIFFSGVIAFTLVVVGIIFSNLWRRSVSGKNRELYSSLRRDVACAFPRSTRVLHMIQRSRRVRGAPAPDKVEV